MTTATEPRTNLYPSRTSDRPSITFRSDPILHGPPTGSLTPFERDRFLADGFLSFSRLFDTAECTTMLDEAEALQGQEGLRAREDVITEPNGDRIRSIFDVHEKSSIFDQIIRSPRVLKRATDILGGDVYLFQSRINYKPSFVGKEFYWHSDFETWHVEDGMPRMRAVSCSISLTDNHEFNGPLMLIPGSHTRFVECVGETPEGHYKQSLKRQDHGVPDPASLETLMKEGGGIVQSTAPAGSMTMFDCNTMHGSNSNITPLPRVNLFVVFSSIDNQLESPFSDMPPRPSFLANRDNPTALEVA